MSRGVALYHPKVPKCCLTVDVLPVFSTSGMWEERQGKEFTCAEGFLCVFSAELWKHQMDFKFQFLHSLTISPFTWEDCPGRAFWLPPLDGCRRDPASWLCNAGVPRVEKREQAFRGWGSPLAHKPHLLCSSITGNFYNLMRPRDSDWAGSHASVFQGPRVIL